MIQPVNIEDDKTIKEHTWNYAVNKKRSTNQNMFDILDLLGVFTSWNGSPTVLKEFQRC